MGQINNLNDSQLPRVLREVRSHSTAAPLNNAAIGRGGIEVYDGGVINISNGGLVVNGSAQIVGTLNADGTINMSGIFIATGEVQLNGPVTIAGNTEVTGTLTTNGPLDVNGTTTLDGDTTATGTLTTNGALTVNGATEVNGNLDVDGTLKINGAATLNNNLTVASGKKITLGSMTLENTGAGGGQVNFPGGSITASTALGMLINHATVEIAGTTVKISSLPATTQPANIYADTNGRLYRSTAA